jgi:hypothetical protein
VTQTLDFDAERGIEWPGADPLFRACSRAKSRYLQILNHRLLPRWGKIATLEIQPLEVRQWLKASKRKENFENPTVDKIRRVMLESGEMGSAGTRQLI